MQIRLHTSVFTIGRKSPGRSQFYSDHRVNFSLYTAVYLANPLPLDRSLFAFILCFYDKKSSKKQQCGENASNGVNYEVLSANDRIIYVVLSANVKRPAGLHSVNVKRPAGLLLSDPLVAADLVITYNGKGLYRSTSEACKWMSIYCGGYKELAGETPSEMKRSGKRQQFSQQQHAEATTLVWTCKQYCM